MTQKWHRRCYAGMPDTASRCSRWLSVMMT